MFMCGFYVMNLHTSAKRVTVKSIAVLPFTGLDGAGPDRLLGLGMADTVTSKLGGLPGIEVRSPVAIRRYVDTPPEPLDTGRGLQVEAVLTGNIQHQQQSVRITAQLCASVTARRSGAKPWMARKQNFLCCKIDWRNTWPSPWACRKLVMANY